ncbi:lysozyme family protein, partial [Clostridium perfringens]
MLAIIQEESGGPAEDVMHSSQIMGIPPTAHDTDSSIQQECKDVATRLS